MSIVRRGASYTYDFWYQRKRYRGTIGPVSRKTAEAFERKRKVEVAEGLLRPPVPTMAPSFAAFAEEFLAWYCVHRRPQSGQRIGYIVRRMVKTFGPLRLDELSTRRVEAYMRDRLQTCKPATVNMDLEVIRHLLSTAKRWKVIAEHPCIDAQKVRDDEPETRVISADEEARLLACCPDWLQPLVRFGLLTGLRRNELGFLEWRDVEWQGPSVIVVSHRAKSRKRREVPLCETAVAILELVPRTQARVFAYHSFGTAFRLAARRANLPDVTPKSLRHTFATRCLERGVAIRVVQRWLGHASLRMTERYTHPSRAYEREMIRVLDRHPPTD